MVMLKNIGNEIGLDQAAFISGLVEEPNTTIPGVSTVDPNISDENDRCLGHYCIWIILIVGFLYTILSIGILYKMLSANPPQPRRYRVGYRYKILFMVLLFVSCLFRGLGNFIVYIMNARFMNYALVTSVVRTAPSLVFITGYSVFIYFFGKLASYEEKSYNIARPILIFLNILSYAGYIFISLLYKENNTLDYIYTISGFYGIIYLIISILLLIFCGKVCMIIIEKKSLSLATANSKERKAFDSISKKLNYLTIFLVMMFFLRAAYNLMFSWGIVNTIFTLQYYWQTAESIFFFLTEFIPIIITVAVFYSGGSGAFMIDFDIEETHMWMKKMYNDDELDIIAEENESSEFGSFNPNLKQKLLVNEYRKNLS